MIFKNIIVFRLNDTWNPSAQLMADQLKPFQPCGEADMISAGWEPPLQGGGMAFEVGGQIILSLRVEEKIIPGSVIRKQLDAAVEKIEKEQSRKVGRKEKTEMKDAIAQELRHRAFTKDKRIPVWIDTVNRTMVVSGNPAAADKVIEQLRTSLGQIDVTLAKTERAPESAMTAWLAAGEVPGDFTIDADCELVDPSKEGSAVKFTRHSLGGSDVKEYLANGKTAKRLAMTYNDRVSLVLTGKLEVKKIRMLDIVTEQAAGGDMAADSAFTSDIALETGELAKMLKALLAAIDA